MLRFRKFRRRIRRTREYRRYRQLVAQETLIFEVAEMFQKLIEGDGLTREQLAERLGHSEGFVRQILAGDRNMTLRTLSDVAFALDHRIEIVVEPLHDGEGMEMEDDG